MMPDTSSSSPLNRRRLLCGCAGLALLGLAACGRRDEPSALRPQEIPAGASCALDGMLLADYPGPKGQILFAGEAQPQWFCDTVELLSMLLKPEQLREQRGAWVQDMALADWERPVGHWVDARQAFYVLGSRRHGSMGPTAASFAEADKAQAFAAQYGGQVHPFAQLKPEMVDLSGGALHDSRM